MKKLLLTLGTVAAVATPVASVIACGSTAENYAGTATKIADLSLEFAAHLSKGSTISFNIDKKLSDEEAKANGLYLYTEIKAIQHKDAKYYTQSSPSYADKEGGEEVPLYNYQIFIVDAKGDVVLPSETDPVKLYAEQARYKEILEDVLPTHILNMVEDHSMLIDPTKSSDDTTNIDTGVSHLLANHFDLSGTPIHKNEDGETTPIEIVYTIGDVDAPTKTTPGQTGTTGKPGAATGTTIATQLDAAALGALDDTSFSALTTNDEVANVLGLSATDLPSELDMSIASPSLAYDATAKTLTISSGLSGDTTFTLVAKA